MKINKAFKFRIYSNSQQKQFLAQSFGCARFIYNRFLRQRIDYYAENSKGLTYHNNALALTQLKKLPEFEWLNNISAQSLQQALRNLDVAYNNFFNKQAKFPNFKKKSNKQAFNVPQDFSIHDNKLDIPKCKGIKIKLHRTIEGTIKSITISKTPSGKYFASVLCELEIPESIFPLPPCKGVGGGEIGIDYGVKAFITTSDGKSIESPKFLRKSEKRLNQLSRSFSRKQPSVLPLHGGTCNAKNRYKAQKQLARQHEKVSNQRQDFLHKTSKQLVSDNQAIYIESLAIRNMIKLHTLAKSISDSGWNMFVNMLKYKGQWYGCRIIEIDRWFPSSKRCHVCGYINDNLTLSDRSWLCPECNTDHDRDVNASINILTFGRAGIARTILPSLCSSVARRNVIGGTRNACGEGSPSVFDQFQTEFDQYR
jgi:putative transposase